MKIIKIFDSNLNTLRTLKFHNLSNQIEGYDIIYTSNIDDLLDCDVCVVYAECCWNNFRFKTNAQIRICFTGEPKIVYPYSSDFFNQFTDVVTSQNDVKVNSNVHIHFQQQCLNYFVGYNPKEQQLNEKIICDTYYNRSKTKLLSVIVSNKCMTVNHIKRQQFITQLKRDIPQLDIFGTITGQQLDYKDYALREYKYSIAIENCQVKNYWTEKIADCIYALTEPIYCGCLNISDYFSDITAFDLNNYACALEIIKKRISQPYDIDSLIQRRNKLLKEYSLHAVIRNILKSY